MHEFPSRTAIDITWLPAHLRLHLSPKTFWNAFTSSWDWNVYIATGIGAACATAPAVRAAQATIRAVSLVLVSIGRERNREDRGNLQEHHSPPVGAVARLQPPPHAGAHRPLTIRP